MSRDRHARERKPARRMSRREALVRLRRMKQAFSRYIGRDYGHLAADCAACPTPCCADAQFVNINITRIEAEAMIETLRESPRRGEAKLREVVARAETAIQTYGLSEEGDTFAKTYACPLYEKGVGCLVHWKAKPAPCIQHGCYEHWEDLPETGTMQRVEARVEQIDAAVHGRAPRWMTIPVWLTKVFKEENDG